MNKDRMFILWLFTVLFVVVMASSGCTRRNNIVGNSWSSPEGHNGSSARSFEH